MISLDESVHPLPQILTGWGAKTLLYYLSYAFQSVLVGSNSYCEGWLPPTCFLVCLGVALAMTGLGALTAFLPTAAPPKRLGCDAIRLHLCALLAGATALPLGYAWHIAFDDLIRILTLRTFTSECDDYARLLSEDDYSRFSEGIEWLLESIVEVFYSFLLALLCAWLKTRLTRLFAKMKNASASDAKKTAASRLAERMSLLVAKTCDFCLAWALFDVVAALFSSIDSSPCFPDRGGGLTSKWATLLVYALFLLLLAVLKSTNGLGGFERRRRALA